jgi:hypothetical protein
MGLVAGRKLSAASLILPCRILLASPQGSRGARQASGRRGSAPADSATAPMLAVVEFHLDRGAARCDYSPPASAIIVPEALL